MLKNNNITTRLLVEVAMLCAFMCVTLTLSAQADKKFIREGNKEFQKSNFSESEIAYRKAIDKNAKSPDAVFNVGDALYKQNKFEDAGKQFVENINMNEDRNKKAGGLYNLGNSLLQAKKLEESIAAYKESLKLKPDSKEAKYNLAYAQDLLVQQQEQDKENKDNKKDDQNKDQKDQKDKQQQDQKNQQDQKQKQQQNQEQGISKEDAQRLLNALANDEKNTQEKVKLAKASKEKVRTIKNW